MYIDCTVVLSYTITAPTGTSEPHDHATNLILCLHPLHVIESGAGSVSNVNGAQAGAMTQSPSAIGQPVYAPSPTLTSIGSTTRPTWVPPVSHCWELPGFSTVDKYPIRSPLAVADFLAPRVEGRAFCEIGTRNGDIMSCLSHHAKSVTAIELDTVYCAKLRARGFKVLCQPFESVPPAQLSACEVYFWWPMDAEAQNEKWLKQLLATHRTTGTNATVYVAHDTHFKNDMVTLPKLVKRYSGSISRLFFDEGGALTGEASYSTPFYGRPGRWGVFHLATFAAGHADPQAPLPHKRIRSSGARAVAATARAGFCSTTEETAGVGDCEGGEKGYVRLQDPSMGFVTSLASCVDWCLQYCARCRYVSYSAQASDCSWYQSCDLDNLDQRWQTTSKHVSQAVVPAAGWESMLTPRGGRRRGRGRGRGRKAMPV